MLTQSKQLAGLIGPTLLALSATEALNVSIYVVQMAPVVYLNGTILFVAGLALVRAHNSWRMHWSTLITIVGWAALLVGLYRMVLPQGAQAGDEASTYALLALLFVTGAILTGFGYLRPSS